MRPGTPSDGAPHGGAVDSVLCRHGFEAVTIGVPGSAFPHDIVSQASTVNGSAYRHSPVSVPVSSYVLRLSSPAQVFGPPVQMRSEGAVQGHHPFRSRACECFKDEGVNGWVLRMPVAGQFHVQTRCSAWPKQASRLGVFGAPSAAHEARVASDSSFVGHFVFGPVRYGSPGLGPAGGKLHASHPTRIRECLWLANRGHHP